MRNVYLDYSATTPVKEEVLKEDTSLTSEEYDLYLNLYHNDARIRTFYNNAFGFDWNNEFLIAESGELLNGSHIPLGVW